MTASWADEVLKHLPQGIGEVEAGELRVVITPRREPARAWSDEELMALPRDGRKFELIGGELEVSPAGAFHGSVITRLIRYLSAHVEANGLGDVFDGQTGFRLTEGELVSPDVSFVSAARLKGLTHAPTGFYTAAPDLAIEVLSPTDSATKMSERAPLLFTHGTRLLWVINPMDETAMVYHRGDSPDRLLTRTDSLDGEEVVPGFRLALAMLFAPYRF